MRYFVDYCWSFRPFSVRYFVDCCWSFRPFSSHHCIICPSSINDFRLPLRHLLKLSLENAFNMEYFTQWSFLMKLRYICFVDRCLSLFLLPLCCLYLFVLRILITPLVSPNLYCKHKNDCTCHSNGITTEISIIP